MTQTPHHTPCMRISSNHDALENCIHLQYTLHAGTRVCYTKETCIQTGISRSCTNKAMSPENIPVCTHMRLTPQTMSCIFIRMASDALVQPHRVHRDTAHNVLWLTHSLRHVPALGWVSPRPRTICAHTLHTYLVCTYYRQVVHTTS